MGRCVVQERRQVQCVRRHRPWPLFTHHPIVRVVYHSLGHGVAGTHKTDGYRRTNDDLRRKSRWKVCLFATRTVGSFPRIVVEDASQVPRSSFPIDRGMVLHRVRQDIWAVFVTGYRETDHGDQT